MMGSALTDLHERISVECYPESWLNVTYQGRHILDFRCNSMCFCTRLLVLQGAPPKEMPSWMSFLHDKMKNPSQDLFNVKLFIAKLIINTSEVSSRHGLHHFVGFVTGFVLKNGINE